MSELTGYSEHTDEARTEENLENSIVQDDYKKLKQENEHYKQELYSLRLKLKASNAIEKELQEVNETLEQSFAQCTIKSEKMLLEKDEKYRAAREEYNDHIASLEANIAQNVQEITELHVELKRYKDLMNDRLHNQTSNDDNLILYKEKNDELISFLQNESDKRAQLEEKYANMENQYQELEDILRITKEQLAEKNIVLEQIREELAVTRTELESLKVRPASDTCKGNSLFAEVEDNRQMLLNKMKVIQDKYNEMKRVLNTKIDEIKILRMEKAAMVKKWETDAIDTLQENTDLLDKYKSKISEVENKLKIEMKRNNQVVDVQSTGDSFNYAQSLLIAKKEQLEQLNQKLERQSIEMLAQEEATYNISKQLRYWQSKAMSMEVQISSMKAQLETERTNDNANKISVDAIENSAILGNVNLQKTSGFKLMSDMPGNSTYQHDATEMSKGSVIDRYISRKKDVHEKDVRFVKDTKDIKYKALKI